MKDGMNVKAAGRLRTTHDEEENPSSHQDALSVAVYELERLSRVLDDLTAHTMIDAAAMDDEHPEYAALMRNLNRILVAESSECWKVLWQLLEEDAMASRRQRSRLQGR